MINKLYILSFIVFLNIQFDALAENGSTEIHLKGNLVRPPECSINDGELLVVDFGSSVSINKINGENYKIPVKYNISCQNAIDNMKLKLSIYGNSASFNEELLATNIDELGIIFYANDRKTPINSDFFINPALPPKLIATPIKKDGSELRTGLFESSATLRAEYQ